MAVRRVGYCAILLAALGFAIQAVNRSFLPCAFVRADVLAENVLAQGEKQGRMRQKVYLSVGARGSQTAQSEVISPYCGKVELSVVRVRVYDMLGLFCLPVFGKNVCGPAASAYVVPQVPPVAPHMEAYSMQALDSDIYSPYKPGDDPSYLFGVREYREGDSLRRVHWKLSARLDKPMVKEFGLPLQAGVHFMVRLYKGAQVDEADRLVTAVLSLSQALLEKEVPHRISWSNSTNGIQTINLYKQDDLPEAIHGLLQLGCLPAQAGLLPDAKPSEHIVYMANFSPQSEPELVNDIQALLSGPLHVQVSLVLAGRRPDGPCEAQMLGCAVYWLEEEIQTAQLEEIAL